MNERNTSGEFNGAYPSLEMWELETLAERAVLRGVIKPIDYPEDQAPDQALPYSFVLPIDPEPFEELAEEWRHRGFETVTTAEIEYAQERVLDAGDPPLPPMIYVSTASLIYHPADPTFAVVKDTVYSFPLAMNEPGRVKVTYTETEHGRYELLVGDQQSMLELMAGETRHLTVADIELLRIVLSSE